jgi:hypothetical protein
VSSNVKDMIIKKEKCDVKVHSFATDLLKSRLREMSVMDIKAFREFERKLQLGGGGGHRRGRRL